VRLSGSRPGTSIVLRVTSTEPATLEVSLLRRVSRRGTRQVRGTFRAALAAGANRLVLPRGLWRLRSGSHVLVLRATDAAGNRTTLRMPIRVAVAHRTPTR
jgi:hypothetical protein